MAAKTLRLTEILEDLEDLERADFPVSESSDTSSLSIGVPKSPERTDRRCMGGRGIDLEEEVEGEEIGSTPKFPSGPHIPGFPHIPWDPSKYGPRAFLRAPLLRRLPSPLHRHWDQQWGGKIIRYAFFATSKT